MDSTRQATLAIFSLIDSVLFISIYEAVSEFHRSSHMQGKKIVSRFFFFFPEIVISRFFWWHFERCFQKCKWSLSMTFRKIFLFLTPNRCYYTHICLFLQLILLKIFENREPQQSIFYPIKLDYRVIIYIYIISFEKWHS